MCIAPGKLSSGQKVQCRKCWLCRQNRIDDWVGRCIAESETAASAHSVTLTYGRNERNDPDHERAQVLTYSDVQKYIKRLRFHGYPCRYFAVGEYGSEKGRAHWHIMIFWQNRVPSHVLAKEGATEEEKHQFRFMQEHWPHGWSYFEKPSAASIRYICKYIQKDISAMEKQGHLSMSKKPPLGHDYFVQLAGRYVDQD